MSDEATPKPIDFSALDPSRNQLRWERTIQSLATKAHAERRKRFAVEHELLRWARPVLAVAAAFCLIVWTAGYFAGGRRSSTASAQSATQAPALRLAAWAANDQIPETSELVGTLGGNL
jgi:hypothetical protein